MEKTGSQGIKGSHLVPKINGDDTVAFMAQVKDSPTPESRGRAGMTGHGGLELGT